MNRRPLEHLHVYGCVQCGRRFGSLYLRVAERKFLGHDCARRWWPTGGPEQYRKKVGA